MEYRQVIGAQRFVFADLKTLLAKATPFRSGDALAGSPPKARKNAWRRACGMADIPLKDFLADILVPTKKTRSPVSSWTVMLRTRSRPLRT
jgi:ethanolamine ammonia-lyase large subunit